MGLDGKVRDRHNIGQRGVALMTAAWLLAAPVAVLAENDNLAITSISLTNNIVYVSFGATNTFVYWPDGKPNPTGEWGRCTSYWLNGSQSPVSTISLPNTNATGFFRVRGRDGVAWASGQLDIEVETTDGKHVTRRVDLPMWRGRE